jgi:hypothetical protein
MDKGAARITLACGTSVSAGYAEVFNPRRRVTVVVRPERAHLIGAPAQRVIAWTPSHIVSLGTGIHHVRLDGGSEEFAC